MLDRTKASPSLGQASCSIGLPPAQEQQTPSLFTYSLLNQKVHTHTHTPEPSLACGVPRGPGNTQDSGPALTSLCCRTPPGPAPISRGTTHKLSVSTLCPLSTSPRRQRTAGKHTRTRSPSVPTLHINKEARSDVRASHTASSKHNLSHAAMYSVCLSPPASPLNSPGLPACLGHQAQL